jgi:dihydroorotase
LIVDYVLTNAKTYLNGAIVDCSIAIEGDDFFKIGKETQMPQADQKLNLRNMLVLPGLVDVHTHLRDEGKAYKEDFFSGTCAAAAGGVTTVLDMPNNSPVTMSSHTLLHRMNMSKRKIVVNVGFYSEFPVSTNEIGDIVAKGAVGFKLFMGAQVGGLDLDDDQALKNALTEIGKAGTPVAVHAEDKVMIRKLESEQKLKGFREIDAFLKAHSENVETTAIKRLLKISTGTKIDIHFCHQTNSESLDVIVEAKKEGRSITCEVTPQHLLLSSNDFEREGSMLVMVPPLRSPPNNEALWNAISTGLIDSIGSDHAPHALSEKLNENIWDVKVGVPGLETTLPLLLTMVHKGNLSIGQLIHLTSKKPAEIFNLPRRGGLEKGKKADLVVVDFNKKFRIDASKFFTKAKFSPFNGWEVQGKTEKTFVNGELVFDEDEIVVNPGSGEIIRSAPT